jgi:hypothetical protein
MEKDFSHLIKTFKSSIKTWDYFVDWNKVFSNGADLRTILEKLNCLLGKDDLRREFHTLYQSDPNVIKAFPVLLAVRKSTVEIFDKESKDLAFFDFSSKNTSADKYFEFLEKSGLANLLQHSGIKSLVDYVIGVEVGLDSNARKNRGGNSMEEIVGVLLVEFCNKNGLEYLAQARASTIRAAWGFNVRVNKSERKFDFTPQS